MPSNSVVRVYVVWTPEAYGDPAFAPHAVFSTREAAEAYVGGSYSEIVELLVDAKVRSEEPITVVRGAGFTDWLYAERPGVYTHDPKQLAENDD